MKKHVISYMAGYIVHQLLYVSPKLKCPLCHILLMSHPLDSLDESDSELLTLKNRDNVRNGLVFVSKSVFKITLLAEDAFQHAVAESMENKSSIPFDENMHQKIVQKTVAVLNDKLDMSTIFVEFTDTSSETKSNDEHKMYLLNTYLTRYLKMRCLSFICVLNRKQCPRPSKRNKSRKNVHFTGQ